MKNIIVRNEGYKTNTNDFYLFKTHKNTFIGVTGFIMLPTIGDEYKFSKRNKYKNTVGHLPVGKKIVSAVCVAAPNTNYTVSDTTQIMTYKYVDSDITVNTFDNACLCKAGNIIVTSPIITYDVELYRYENITVNNFTFDGNEITLTVWNKNLGDINLNFKYKNISLNHNFIKFNCENKLQVIFNLAQPTYGYYNDSFKFT